MATPQAGLFNEPGRSAQYLEYQFNNATDQDIRSALKAAAAPVEGAAILFAFSKHTWERLGPGWTPSGLQDFTALSSAKGHVMPATQRDLFVWIVGEDRGDIMNAVVQVTQALEPLAELVLDLDGFKTRDARILTGFVDGTGNPGTDEKKRAAALIPEDEQGAGGAFVLGQKWTHRLEPFLNLSVVAQEKVIGRTKETNIELEGAELPPESHVGRTDIDVEDVPMKMYRRGTPYGGGSDKGLYFLAFACDMGRFTHVIDSMLGKTDGVTDAMMDYSDALTGSYWFMPSQEDLDSMLAG
jgi:putative iron-dependent peroxidase